MDRFTWSFVIGALVLCVIALASVFVTRAAPPPDPTTPEGVVAEYILAVRDRDADRAWELLTPTANVGFPTAPPGVAASPTTSRDAFRQQVANMPRSSDRQPRIRILDTTITGDTARVDVEVTTTSGGAPLFGGGENSQSFTFTLMRSDGTWRIDSAPSVYQLG